jgi:hypothetical protein
MTMPAPTLRANDRVTLALGMASCAVFFGLAINVHHSMYSPRGWFWLTIGRSPALLRLLFT